MDCIGDAASLIEHIAEIKMRQRIARIDRDRLTVVLLGSFVVLAVVIERTQIDVSCSMLGIKLDDALVNRDGLGLIARIFFQGNSPRKQRSHV